MSLPSVTIRPTDGVIVLGFSGTVDLRTFLLGREALRAEPGWSPAYAHVFDFTAVTDMHLSKQDIETLAAARPVFDRNAHQVLVAKTGSFEFSMARTFKALAAGRRNVHLVESLAEALALLATLQ